METIVALLFLCIGAVLASGRLPRNPVVGVRLRWTLADGEVWRDTNRLAGGLLGIWALCLFLSGGRSGRGLMALLLPVPFFLSAVGLHAAWGYRRRHGDLIVPNVDDGEGEGGGERRSPWSLHLLPSLGVLVAAGMAVLATAAGRPPVVPTLFRWTGDPLRFGPPSVLGIYHVLALALFAVQIVVGRRLRGAGNRHLEAPFHRFMTAALLLAETQVLVAELVGRSLLLHPLRLLAPASLLLVAAAGRLLQILIRGGAGEVA